MESFPPGGSWQDKGKPRGVVAFLPNPLKPQTVELDRNNKQSNGMSLYFDCAINSGGGAGNIHVSAKWHSTQVSFYEVLSLD